MEREGASSIEISINSIRVSDFCDAMSIVFLIVERSFANPKLGFFDLQPALIMNKGNLLGIAKNFSEMLI
jgi:hypothetical protein